jgi:putative addiction module component (TIGR02574 family)
MVRNDLIQEILKLDSTDREYVRDVVMASLSDELPAQLSPADQQEVLRRLEAYEKHPDTFQTWEQVQTQLAAQRAGRR